MMNLTDVHEQFSIEEKDFMVKVWNDRQINQISIATFPFVSAWWMKVTINGFYGDIEDEATIVYPRGFSFQQITFFEMHIKKVLGEATRKPENVEPK